MNLLKTTALTAIVAGTFALAGTALAQDKSYVIGVSVPTADHGWTGGVDFFAQQAVDRLSKAYPNLSFVLATAPDSTKQAADLEDMVTTRNIDGLVILPGDPDAMTASIKKVKDAGKWVTVVDRALSQPGIEDLYVAGDNPGLGTTTANYFKSALPNGGNIVVLRGAPIPIDAQRVDAFMAGIEGTNIKVLDSQFANWNRDDGYKIMQDFLTKYPKIDAVWAQDDDTLVGVLKALKEAGRENEMWAVGGAGMNQIVKMVAAGSTQVPVDVSYNPNMVATAIDLTALHFAANAQVDGKMIINSTLITKDNAAQFDYPNTPF
ncbi:ABC transporter substrate-binding protein [Youhaiella tibetensis]|uniref:Substrate-binding domain-containing protein n=1 Tax=Paradevosia tibetensis TaxID=1447062 RepID=A0A5B9DQT3_9HYPH|nr:substrate-binding domain-containing protein [Youhaiella tibetensis]QEE21476.1 substrate-binding domain-containing protein [Youhaiella tibetensis]GGF14709.1 ABC transporter substrate-binding protein [Youhaiella tibetensis]